MLCLLELGARGSPALCSLDTFANTHLYSCLFFSRFE